MKFCVKWIMTLALVGMTGLAMADVPGPAQSAPPPAAASTVAAASSTAPPGVSAAASAPRSGAHPLTAGDLAAFFDGMVPFALKRGDVAGGVISVVKDGKVLFAKGYGYADLKTRERPSPATTLFRPGSTSKLFTWTAVMQLVEQGKLDLDRDINDYLDFRIPPRFGKPITLRNLMTHTPGFEDTARGLIPTDPDAIDLGRYLKTHVPARIFPPGKVVAYSNYGCGLAGYIVQRVSGEPFADYIDKHIFQPLGMHHSTFEQPLPPDLAPLMAKGYKSRSDGEPKPFELVDPAPAGAMSTTALDMTRFMIAQLQDGRYGDARILDKATAERMHSLQHTEVPGMNGFDLGFYQGNRNGQRIIGHAGDTNWFHSDLHLLLDADVGIFMSFNSAGNRGGAHVIRRAVFRAFLDRYFPYDAPSPPTASSAKADAARVVGWYESSRRNESALSMLYLLSQVPVTALPDGTLVVPMLTNPAAKPLHWRETSPLHYRQVHGTAHLVFVAGKDGGIRYAATDDLPPVMVLQRVPAWRSLGMVKPLLGIATLLALATVLIWFFGWWVRRHYRRRLELTHAQRVMRLLSRLGALAVVVVLFGWLAFLVTMTAHTSILLSGAAVPWLYVLYVFGVIGLLGALAMIANTVRVWLAPRRGGWVLAGETLLALAAVYVIWFIFAFGLVSFNVHY